MKNLTEEQIKAAVKWLSDAIINLEGRPDNELDNSIMGRIIKDRVLPTQIELFTKKLSSLIADRGVTKIDCDYMPEGVLLEAYGICLYLSVTSAMEDNNVASGR